MKVTGSWLVWAICISLVFSARLSVSAKVEITSGEENYASPTKLSESQVLGVTAHPILSDLRIRRALAYCTDREALTASAYPALDSSQIQSLLIDTFLPKAHWAYHPPSSEYAYPFNPSLGQQLLEEAGWTLSSWATYRTNLDGYELAIKLTTTNSELRQAWAQTFESQLRGCGIRLVRSHIPSSIWFAADTGLQVRDFELGGYAWHETSFPNGRALFACDQIPSFENNWSGQNFMGWCNPAANEAIIDAEVQLLRQEQIDDYAVVQDEFTKDMVSLPLFSRPSFLAANATLAGFQPDPEESFTWNANDWTVPGADTIRIGFSQEPDTLFPLIENSFVAQRIAGLIYGYRFTNLNYDFQPRFYAAFPTLENGGTIAQTVSVTQGDWVVTADGSVENLEPGMKVFDSTGQQVTYTSGSINMRRLIISIAFLPGLRWSDGVPLVKADLELWDRINCDVNSGATSFIYCQQVAQREYLNDTTVRYTLLPGAGDRGYFVHFLPGAYPSHRVIQTQGNHLGKTLAEVPAGDWKYLPEIIESPLGLGPYRIVLWEKGNRMVFERNPYFDPLPATKNIEIQFLSYAEAEVGLVNGSLDILGDETSGEISDTLQNAIQAGLVKGYVMPTAVWEHVDMNQGFFTQVVAKPVGPAGGNLATSMGVTIEVPPGAVSETTTFLYNRLLMPSQPMSLAALNTFILGAFDAADAPITQLPTPISITIDYSDSSWAGRVESEQDLHVLYWDGTQWEALGFSLDLLNNQVTFATNQLTEFVLVVENRTFLPVISDVSDSKTP